MALIHLAPKLIRLNYKMILIQYVTHILYGEKQESRNKRRGDPGVCRCIWKELDCRGVRVGVVKRALLQCCSYVSV